MLDRYPKAGQTQQISNDLGVRRKNNRRVKVEKAPQQLRWGKEVKTFCEAHMDLKARSR